MASVSMLTTSRTAKDGTPSLETRISSVHGFLMRCRHIVTDLPDLDNFRFADNSGVDRATSGLSQVDYGAENAAGKRWV
jgi:hypothetical protein